MSARSKGEMQAEEHSVPYDLRTVQSTVAAAIAPTTDTETFTVVPGGLVGVRGP